MRPIFARISITPNSSLSFRFLRMLSLSTLRSFLLSGSPTSVRRTTYKLQSPYSDFFPRRWHARAIFTTALTFYIPRRKCPKRLTSDVNSLRFEVRNDRHINGNTYASKLYISRHFSNSPYSHNTGRGGCRSCLVLSVRLMRRAAWIEPITIREFTLST